MSRRAPLSRQVQEATIDGFTHGGEGVARLEGKAVFVPGTLPGERVELRVIDDRKRWARATLVRVLDASPDRVEPPCPFVPECGGCDLQHASPEAQRRLKTRVVTEQLQRLAGLSDPPVRACRAVGPDLGYRTNARLHADGNGALGFHRSGSNEVVAVDRCLVLTPAVQQVRTQVGDDTGAAEVSVRAHPSTDTAAAVLAPGPGPLHLPEGDFDLRLRQPDGSTVGMRGDGILAETVAGHRYRFPSDGFFQVTTHGAEALVETVLAATGDLSGALTYDLYAGAGLLSIPLAVAGAEVIAVEGHEGAAQWAVHNAEDAGVSIQVLAEPVADVLRRAASGDATLEPPDVVVLDPPRSGAGGSVIDRLAELAVPHVVYVACDVAALARDAGALVAHGYQLVEAQPLDLFPMTHHVEVVATFTR
ncbi:MAG: class I SAM-dependent RNA methyltransferase [Nitriliruptoraceae bacterium]|nr:class I SAM-dependent RNA methyltransferase [Nitriliruptoraceae bacterium]